VPTMLKLADTTLSNVTPSTSLQNPMMLAQIALAVKDVPFEDIVFLQYPTFTDPDNPARVVPDRDSAEAMWAAINANQQLQVTHENTGNEGVIVETPAPAEPIEPSDPAVTETPAPAETVAALPETIRGNSAAQQTCSNGNVRD